MPSIHAPRSAPADYVTTDGLWTQIIDARDNTENRPALFLDRDGTIVEDVGYLSRPEELRLIDGAARAIRTANEADIPVVVVTNQSGVGRGYFDWCAFAAVQSHMLKCLEPHGSTVTAVLACPHHAAAAPPYNHPDHPDRKPNPGMITRAAQLLSIDLGKSWLIGDRASDMIAAHRAGLAGGLLVATGPIDVQEHLAAAAGALSAGTFRLLHAASIGDAPSMLPLFSGERIT